VLILFLLAFQFLAGMVVNLYYEIPKVHAGANASEYFRGVIQVIEWGMTRTVWSLEAHIIMGLLIVVTATLIVGFSIVAMWRGWIIAAVCGWVATLGAAFNGASFLMYGHDFSSLIMAACFLTAGISYSAGLFIQRGT
jgi:hypothetical protein